MILFYYKYQDEKYYGGICFDFNKYFLSVVCSRQGKGGKKDFKRVIILRLIMIKIFDIEIYFKVIEYFLFFGSFLVKYELLRLRLG